MKVIFVCSGNTCRSPIAEGYLKSFNIKTLDVKSRGLYADNSPVSRNSVLVANELGFDISSHISSPLCRQDLDADMIICMSPSHKHALQVIGFDESKIAVLGNGIPDPFGGSIETYRICADKIVSEIDKMVFSGAFSDFAVIPISNEHISQIAKLEAACFSEPWSQNAILESISAGQNFFVAVKNKSVLGYIGLNTVLDEGYITNVAVFKGYRNRGIAGLLLQRTFSLARQKALSFISLEVRASNRNAISLYESKGFKPEGIRKDFYREPKEDAVIMTRRFTYKYENTQY